MLNLSPCYLQPVHFSAILLSLALATTLVGCKTPLVPAAKAPDWILGGMVNIPEGTFAMGSDSPDGSDNERPVHSVTVKAFQLDRTEVTVAAYAACFTAGACSEADAFRNQIGDHHIFCNWKHAEDRLSHPINCIDFNQAAAFCAWAGKRLPTEEEWEYAARGGEVRTYPWGNEKPDETRLNGCGTGCPENLVAKRFPGLQPLYAADDGWPETAPVGSFPAGASKDGVLDMAGNVWEWTASLFALYDGSNVETRRVLRGGSWGGGDARTERTTNRFRLGPQAKAQFLGVRCAR